METAEIFFNALCRVLTRHYGGLPQKSTLQLNFIPPNKADALSSSAAMTVTILSEASGRGEQAEISREFLAELFFRIYQEFRKLDQAMQSSHCQPAIPQVPKLNGGPPFWLRRARNILRERFAEHPTLSQIAAEVGVHRVYLARQFRKYYGCSVGEYLRTVRVEFACHQLFVQMTRPSRLPLLQASPTRVTFLGHLNGYVAQPLAGIEQF